MEDSARITALEKRVEALEGRWTAFRRVLRDGLLMITKWVEKNGESS